MCRHYFAATTFFPPSVDPNILNLQIHIRTLEGRIAETILSLRFFIFQYGIVYKLHLQGSNTSLTVTALFIS